MIQALQSGKAGVQAASLGELEALGLDAISALPHVQPLLASPDKRVQAGAAGALAAMRKDAAPAIPDLIALLETPDTPWIMTDMGGIPDPGHEASSALAAIGADAVLPLRDALNRRSRVARFRAASALGEIGPTAQEAAPALLRLLNDHVVAVRLQATWSLTLVVPSDKKAVRTVLGRLKDDDERRRTTAADALKHIRPVPPIVIDALIEALEDENELVQAHAARTLGESGWCAIPAVPALTKMLKSRKSYPYPDGHPYVCRPAAQMAARALGQIGAPARSALPSLLDIIRDTQATFDNVIDMPENNRIARREAAEAAAKIDPDNDALIGVLNDSLRGDPLIRESVAWALATIGAKAGPAHARLVELLREEKSRKIPWRAQVLGVDKNDSAAFETLLEEFARGADVKEQYWPILASILQRCDPHGEKTIPALAREASRPGQHRCLDRCALSRVTVPRLPLRSTT